MSDLSDSSLREDEDDIIAEHENEKSDNENGSSEEEANEDGQNQEEAEEAQEAAPRRIDPKTSRKRVTLNPIPKLNTERLKGPKGIQTIEKYFEGFKFHGKGHEKTDLDRVMKRLEHWCHRLFPKLQFDDFLERMEALGCKRDLQTFLTKYRRDEITADNAMVPSELVDEESDKEESAPVDEFDMLIAEQIEKQKQVMHNNSAFDDLLQASGTNAQNKTETSQTLLASSQENVERSNRPAVATELSDEIKERIERNRQQAIQRRLARLEAMKEEAKRKKLEESESAITSSEPSESSTSDNDKLKDEQNNTAEKNINNPIDEKESSPVKDTISITESRTDSALTESGE